MLENEFDLKDYIDFDLLFIESQLNEIQLVYQINKILLTKFHRSKEDLDIEMGKNIHYFSKYDYNNETTGINWCIIKNQSYTPYINRQVDLFNYQEVSPFVINEMKQYNYLLKLQGGDSQRTQSILTEQLTNSTIEKINPNNLKSISYIIF